MIACPVRFDPPWNRETWSSDATGRAAKQSMNKAGTSITMLPPFALQIKKR
jgi:hypothetical protein